MKVFGKSSLCQIVFTATLMLALGGGDLVGQDKDVSNGKSDLSEASPEPQESQTQALHEKLSKYLTGTKWTGQFTMSGQAETRTEYYEILTAEKNEVGDYWNLVARIKYGDHDQTFPLPPIEIKFADRTPVITIDKVTFPGFGTFDARVLIRQGKYAGTWAHSGGVGGHLFGVIERMDVDQAKEDAKKVKSKSTQANEGDAGKR